MEIDRSMLLVLQVLPEDVKSSTRVWVGVVFVQLEKHYINSTNQEWHKDNQG